MMKRNHLLLMKFAKEADLLRFRRDEIAIRSLHMVTQLCWFLYWLELFLKLNLDFNSRL